MKLFVVAAIGSASAVSYSQLPAGIVAPSSGYSDYIPDANTGNTCVPEWQACGHADWSVSGTWDYAAGGCCSGLKCDPTQYTCMVDSSAASSCTSNSPPAGVSAPSGYCNYAQESTNVAVWGSCGHPDWNVASNWVYSSCASGLECQSSGGTADAPQYSCLTPAVQWSSEDAAMMCSCCQNSCGFKVTYDCLAVDESNCNAYGGFYHYCDASQYNPTTCAQYKEVDQLNWYDGELVSGPTNWPSKVFAPYLDGGLYPILKVSEVQKAQGINFFILAFVVAKNDQGDIKCIPTIGSVQDIRTGPMSYNDTTQGYDYFYDEVNKLRKAGGDVAISFGGALNTELADAPACTPNGDISNLVEAYATVVEATKASHLDFDIEGAGIGSNNMNSGWTYRFKAVIELQKRYPDLKISFTLPVLDIGFTLDGMNFIDLMMKLNAPFEFFNLMTMDYGDEGCDLSQTNAMAKCEISAIQNVAQQMYTTAQTNGRLAQYGWNSVQDVYPKLGSTPMIGLNDLTNEMYTLDDAKMVYQRVTSDLPLRLWSQWSIWRDAPCSYDYVDTKCTSRGPQGVSGVSPVPAQTSAYQYSAIQKQFSQ